MSGKGKQTHKRLQIKKIEAALRQYRSYKVGVRNLQRQLDYILPSMTVNYEAREGSSGLFVISSTTEKAAIDRIESKRALDIHEQIKEYEMLISSIDESMKDLDDLESDFIRFRYFEGWQINKCAMKMDYSEQNLFLIRNRLMDKLLISLVGILEFY